MERLNKKLKTSPVRERLEFRIDIPVTPIQDTARARGRREAPGREVVRGRCDVRHLPCTSIQLVAKPNKNAADHLRKRTNTFVVSWSLEALNTTL